MPVQSAFQSVRHRDWVLPGESLGSPIICMTLQSLYLVEHLLCGRCREFTKSLPSLMGSSYSRYFLSIQFHFPSKYSVSLLPKPVRYIYLGLFPCVVACPAICRVSVITFRRILEGLIFWDMTVCLLINSYKLLGGASFLHLHGLISLLCPHLLDSIYPKNGDSQLLCNMVTAYQSTLFISSNTSIFIRTAIRTSHLHEEQILKYLGGNKINLKHVHRIALIH